MFFAKIIIGKCKISKCRERPRPSSTHPPLPMPIVAYGGNVGEFMSWLTFS